MTSYFSSSLFMISLLISLQRLSRLLDFFNCVPNSWSVLLTINLKGDDRVIYGCSVILVKLYMLQLVTESVDKDSFYYS